ncbi:MAG: hypothetical protein LC687_00145 [Actinobacteria bacterium]|nr:hypothetical protein [Actinomycetota bacterium]MCA1806280.1 hypothetical protein [Actinomycetota bacterium]
MCSIILTANPFFIPKAMQTPAFVSRASKGSEGTLWALDFSKSPHQDLIITEKLDIGAYSFNPEDTPEDIMGHARLYIAHLHSPTGPTWRPHPASKQINSIEGNYEISAHLWHNGQIINTPNQVWDTSDLLDNLVSDDVFRNTDKNEGLPDEMGGLINWDYLDEVEGTFACALYINVKTLGDGDQSHSESRLYVFRNAMAPLMARNPMTMEPWASEPRLTDPIFLDERSYVSSVPLIGDEALGKGTTVLSNVIYRVDYHSHNDEGEPIFVLASARLINNTYNPYGV